MDAQVSARDIISRLSADDLRRRIAEIDAERKALMTLLRAAMRAGARRSQRPVEEVSHA